MTSPRKPPTMADVARIASVSPMTVSRAFRRDTSVSETTRQAILRAAEDLGYVFDSTASNLRSQKTGFVAVTIPSINNANFADTVRGLSDGLQEQGLQILLGYTDDDIHAEERLIEQLLRRRPEAIVVTGGRHTDRARRLLLNAGIPVVETWDLPDAPMNHVVGFSNAQAVQGMVHHLIAAGLTRLCFIGGDADSDSRGADRRAGFIAAMQAHSLDPTRLIAAGKPPSSMREGATAMAHLLAVFPDTQAVICSSDLSAFGALTECQRRGIAVPTDLAIAGFGDYEIGGICVPPLTTINPFPRDIGLQSAQVILGALSGRIAAPQRVVITPELLVRGSTGD